MAKAPSKKSAPKAKKAKAKSATAVATAPATPVEAKSKNTCCSAHDAWRHSHRRCPWHDF